MTHSSIYDQGLSIDFYLISRYMLETFTYATSPSTLALPCVLVSCALSLSKRLLWAVVAFSLAVSIGDDINRSPDHVTIHLES